MNRSSICSTGMLRSAATALAIGGKGVCAGVTGARIGAGASAAGAGAIGAACWIDAGAVDAGAAGAGTADSGAIGTGAGPAGRGGGGAATVGAGGGIGTGAEASSPRTVELALDQVVAGDISRGEFAAGELGAVTAAGASVRSTSRSLRPDELALELVVAGALSRGELVLAELAAAIGADAGCVIGASGAPADASPATAGGHDPASVVASSRPSIAARNVRHASAPAARRSGVASGATAARIESSMDSMNDLMQKLELVELAACAGARGLD